MNLTFIIILTCIQKKDQQKYSKVLWQQQLKTNLFIYLFTYLLMIHAFMDPQLNCIFYGNWLLRL